MSRYLVLFLLLNGAVAQGSPDPAEDQADPVRWLETMNRSVANLSYEGRFVYLSGKSLEAMQIRHQIIDGRPRESLLSLTGTPREVIRDNHTLTIVTRVNGKTQEIRHPSTGKLLPLKSLQPGELKSHYRIVMGGLARIAGRYGVVVKLIPRDDLRFGYRLILDRESALPLDLTVIDASGELVSRIMFTRLVLSSGGDVAASPVGAEEVNRIQRIAATSSSSHGDGQGKQQAHSGASAEESSPWHFPRPPAGFSLISHQRLGTNRQEHFVFSDGLATISAYLEPLKEGDTPFEGEARLGSINALGRYVHGQQLTVVGEVPGKTLRLLAETLERKQ